MQRLIFLTFLTLTACAPTTENVTQLPTQNSTSILAAPKYPDSPYTVIGGRMENNFLPEPCSGCRLAINFNITTVTMGTTKIGTTSTFWVVYTGPERRFLNGTTTFWIDGVKYGGAMGAPSSQTVIENGVMEVSAHVLSANTLAALSKAKKVEIELAGTIPLRAEFAPENISRLKDIFDK